MKSACTSDQCFKEILELERENATVSQPSKKEKDEVLNLQKKYTEIRSKIKFFKD